MYRGPASLRAQPDGRKGAPMTGRDALLWAIAENPADDAPRLVLSDWLEENGDAERAELLRLQCELAGANLAAERRHTLRVRERALFDTHYPEWREAFGLPLDELTFARGLVSSLRLAAWDGGRMLEPTCAASLAPLIELDLSGLGLGDEGLIAFARQAQLPALRKLLLSSNGITSAGVAALAAATGLPRLDTLYLFDNPVGNLARAPLARSRGFTLTDLDLGEPEDGYRLSPGEADVARRQFVRGSLLPVVAKYFAQYPLLQSAVLTVAQYWADEADDAVHATLVVSELLDPLIDGVTYDREEGSRDPNLPNTEIQSRWSQGSSSAVSLYENNVRWDDNSDAIPLWAAFAPEEGSQEYEDLGQVYAPAVRFYKHGRYEILPMLRPQLDGVRPEWDREEA